MNSCTCLQTGVLAHLPVDKPQLASVLCAGEGGALDQELGDNAAAPVPGSSGNGCSA